MYPHERSLVEQYKNDPFVIIGVNSDEDRAKIREIVKSKNLTWRSFWNGPEGTQGPIATRWAVEGWPMTYLIDAQGVIRYSSVFGERLDAAIAELVAEAKP